MSEIIIQFSTAAPVAFFDRWILDRSKLICRLSHSPFSHGDIVMHDGALLGSSNSPQAPCIRGNPGGVAIRPPEYEEFCIRRWARVPCSEGTKLAFYAYAADQLGKPFDRGALNFKTFLSADFRSRNWREDTAWYCHELIARACEVAGVFPWKLIGIKNRVTSADLLLMLNPLLDVDAFWRPVPSLSLSKWEHKHAHRFPTDGNNGESHGKSSQER